MCMYVCVLCVASRARTTCNATTMSTHSARDAFKYLVSGVGSQAPPKKGQPRRLVSTYRTVLYTRPRVV